MLVLVHFQVNELLYHSCKSVDDVFTLSLRTNRPEQIVFTRIRYYRTLGLHCFPCILQFRATITILSQSLTSRGGRKRHETNTRARNKETHKKHTDNFSHHITKTYLYNFDPLNPHFYIVKLGIKGVYIIFLISAQKYRLWYSLEPPRRGDSNEYPQSMFWAEIWNISDFSSESFQILVVKISIYLNSAFS